MLVKAVICTLNEAPSVGPVIEGTSAHVDEVVVMDAASADGTCEVAAQHGARCERLDFLGKGGAIRHAIATEQADVFVFIDGDGSHDPDDIPRLLAPIRADDADLVIGSRITGGSDELDGDPGHLARDLGSRVIRWAINARFGTRLTDVQNGYRAIRADVARELDLSEPGFTIEQEMVMKCLLHGYRVTNVPSHEHSRTHGTSRLSALTQGYRFVWNLLVTVLRPRVGPTRRSANGADRGERP